MDHSSSVVSAPACKSSAPAQRQAALAVSVGVHALVLALWIDKPAAQAQPRAPTQALRALTVRLHATPAPLLGVPAREDVPPSTQAQAPARPARKAAPVRTAAVTAAPLAAPLAAPVEAPAEPLAPPPVAAPAPDGSAFAGLFAPVISQPLGRSGWGRAARRAPDDAPAPLPPEQALAALRMSLLERLNLLGGGRVSDEPTLHCDIAVDGKRRVAEIQCADPADRAMPWGALQELLAAGTVAPRDADLCFTLSASQVASVPCSPAGPTAGR